MPFGPFKPVVVFPYVPPPPAPRRVEYRVKLTQPPRQRTRRLPFVFLRRLPRVAPAASLGPRVKLAPANALAGRSQRRRAVYKLRLPAVVILPPLARPIDVVLTYSYTKRPRARFRLFPPVVIARPPNFGPHVSLVPLLAPGAATRRRAKSKLNPPTVVNP